MSAPAWIVKEVSPDGIFAGSEADGWVMYGGAGDNKPPDLYAFRLALLTCVRDAVNRAAGTDAVALDAIAALFNREHGRGFGLAEIANLVRATGRTVNAYREGGR